MQKAIKAIQRSYQRAPFKQFVQSQKAKPRPVPNRAVSMEHQLKRQGKF